MRPGVPENQSTVAAASLNIQGVGEPEYFLPIDLVQIVGQDFLRQRLELLISGVRLKVQVFRDH